MRGQITAPRRIYDTFSNHWWVSALIVTIPAYFFLFLQFKGEAFGFVTPGGTLTALGYKWFWGMFGISLIYAFVKSRADYLDRQGKTSGNTILKTLLECTNNITAMNLGSCLEWIKNYPGVVAHLCNVCKPHAQLSHILNEIEIALSSIFGIPRGDIGLSILLHTSDKWEFFCAKSIDNDLDLGSVIKDPNSTFNSLIRGNNHSVFLPDKRIGIVENKYTAGKKDKENNNVGSILCRDITIHTYRAILCITTYGKQLCESEDSDTKSKIETSVIPPFEVRIKLALAQWIMQQIAPQGVVEGNVPDAA